MSNRQLHVNLIMQGELEHKVHAIKQVRGATGMGLREAKETVELAVRDGMAKITLAEGVSLNSLKYELDKSNIMASSEYLDKYIEQLKEIASVATLKGDYYVAKTIISLLDERF